MPMPTTTKTPTPSASDSSHLLAGCQNKAHSFGCLQRFHSDCAPSSKLGEIRFSYFPLLGFRPIPKEKYDFFGPRTLTHAAVVFLLVKKSMCACLLAVPQFCSPGKSVSPEKLLPVGARGAPYGKGRFNNQMRWSACGAERKIFPSSSFRDNNCVHAALYPLS